MTTNSFNDRTISRMQAIDRENGEEMNIYANLDYNDEYDKVHVCRGTEDNKRNQTSQHRGSDCVRKLQSHRSVSVCLVVLCVLLLTAVIVMCVLIYTNNHQCDINNKNITQERDKLLTKYTNITEERDQLLTKYIKYNNITKQYEQLIQEKNELLKYLQYGWTLSIDRFSFYYISSERKNWTESRRYCRERGGDLIIINNKEEQDFVQKMSVGAYVWIGLSDSGVEGRWKWVDGSTMTYSLWMTGEPNKETKENCVTAHLSLWYDFPCNYVSKWICKKNIIK